MVTPQLTCTRCGFRGDVVTEAQKIGAHLFAVAILFVAAVLAAGSLGAVATFYVAAHDLSDYRAKLSQTEASIAATHMGPTMVPVRLKTGEIGRVPLGSLDDPSIDKVLSPAEYREHRERSIKSEIDSDEITMAIAALLGLVGMGATVVIARLVGKRQRYWQTYAFCAACNAPLGRLRGQ